MGVLLNQVRPTGTDPVKLKSGPANACTVVICNSTSTSASASVYLLDNDPDDATPTADHALLYQLAVDANSGDILSADKWLGWPADKVLWVESETASALTFQLFGDG